MKRIFALLICASMMFSAIPVFAGEATAEAIIKNEPEWAEFTANWNDSVGATLNLHPYYQLNLVYFITLSDDELNELLEYMQTGQMYYEAMLDNPVQHKWDWVDDDGNYHKPESWENIPFKARQEALRGALANWEALEFTSNKLIPLAFVFKAYKDYTGLDEWFLERYPNITDSKTGDGLSYADESNMLRRNMMDSLGFEKWPIR